tara:strand:- start:1864 stop:2403 length:540 start_codon:yes stop_codon:yes gene_type:complete
LSGHPVNVYTRDPAFVDGMPLVTTPRGTLSAALSKVVAAAQRWRCNGCQQLLSAAYQIDHRIPLWRGGEDRVENLQALCPNCHAAKTQREAIARRLDSERADKLAEYDDREDVVVRGQFRCSRCLQVRPLTAAHPVCWPIEQKYGHGDRVRTLLARFAFGPRTPCGWGGPSPRPEGSPP